MPKPNPHRSWNEFHERLTKGRCLTFAEHICPTLDCGVTKDSVCLCVAVGPHERHYCPLCGYEWIAGQEAPEVIAERKTRCLRWDITELKCFLR
jgi:hypothetical protein